MSTQSPRDIANGPRLRRISMEVGSLPGAKNPHSVEPWKNFSASRRGFSRRSVGGTKGRHGKSCDLEDDFFNSPPVTENFRHPRIPRVV